MSVQVSAHPRLAAHLQRFLDLSRWALTDANSGQSPAPHGILLSGPPGGGKTRLTRYVAESCGASLLLRDGIELLDDFLRTGPDAISEAFDKARAQAPCVLLIRDIEVLAPLSALEHNSAHLPLAVRLFAEIDRLGEGSRVLVTGTTAHPNRISPELRRPGRLLREIVVPVPDREARRQLLEREAARFKVAADLDFDLLARSASGMTGSDLQSVCLEAWLTAVRRDPRAPEMRLDDFLSALQVVEPTSHGAVYVETPHIRWEHIGGSEEVKRRLEQLIEWPLKHGDLFGAAGVTANPRVLMRGPSGSGKTLLARALARESGASLLSLHGRVFRTQHADPAAALQEAFRRARQAAPCILFLDELDALLGKDLLQPFLAEMGDAARLRGIAVLAATSHPELLDPGLLAPRLFAEVIDVSLPDLAERREILRLHLSGRPVASNLNLDLLARQSDGASGADLAAMCQRALHAAVCRVIEGGANHTEVCQEDFQPALDDFRVRRRRHFT
jgi:transitional endoplasmic reticulum ATPase